MTRRVCDISTKGIEVILHLYVPESHRVTCSMIKVCSSNSVDWLDCSPGFTLEFNSVGKVSVIIVLVPLIQIKAISSTVTQYNHDIIIYEMKSPSTVVADVKLKSEIYTKRKDCSNSKNVQSKNIVFKIIIINILLSNHYLFKIPITIFTYNFLILCLAIY